MKKLILGICLCILSNFVYSQISRIFYSSYGFSVLTDMHISSSPIVAKHFEGKDFYTSYQHFQFNLASFYVGGRMNIANITDNATLSLHTKPTVGFGLAYEIFDGGNWYSSGVSIPVLLEYNYGIASRYKTLKYSGFFVGGGVEYFMYPLVGFSLSDTDVRMNEYQKKWISLVFSGGFRYMNDKNITKEINFSVGIGQDAKEFITFEDNLEKEKRPFSVKISFSRIFI